MCLGFTARTLGSTMELFRHPVPFPSSSSSLSSSHTLLPCYFGHFLPSFPDSIPRKMKLLLPANPTSPCLYRSSPKQASERLAMVIAMRSVEVAAIQPKLESRNVMETLTSFSAMTRKPAESANVDSITVLHRQLDKMQADIPFLAHGREWQDDYSAIMVEKLKETRKQGMMLMNKKENRVGEMAGNDIDEAFYGVDPATLIPGEIVVHKARGVAKFVSTKNELTIGKDEPVEYVYLQYADGMAKLKSSQARRLLYRYFQPGENGKPPTLSKLNDSRQWEKKKRKGRLAIQKMVRNLMLLYIQRLKQVRPPYPKNEALMAKFAAKFPYHPTPDQEQAFFDVERDMTERGTPMDRLVCGDVGFGKTEVALRAIFRVVCAGKQAMVLAPTTVLAKQHYEVIRERFACFNYKVALLSRFQKTAEKKDVVKQIKDGTLNIVVGTHALLGKSIAYNNLGLLVVDEEHRFGVKQKERITSFKTSVDVLTLSATPIPRTLYLALSGFRDASLIATPPPERVPIQTHLCQYDENLIKSAIDFELSRGGQVFYVVPRIKSLAAKQEALEMLFPDNTIGVAHGKQSGNILEETFDKFSSGKIDILLCTNIIESGLDIQRVNTIVVEDVQLFGLAQLHQLRGRVGRADQESHAYLVYPDKDRLTDEAVERLVAIEECCGIGQGFKLAERDLLLRGFGSIFGEMQSGEVAHIGIDLFFEMLFDSLSKAEKSSLSQLKYKDVELDIEVETIIPSEYIADKSTRQILYQKLEAAASKGIRDLMQFTRELRSEYGKEPPSFELTLKAIYIKRMASNLGIYHIEPSGKTVIMETNMNKEDFEILMDSVALESMQSSLSFQNGQIELKLLVELPGERMLEWIFIALMELHKGIPGFVM